MKRTLALLLCLALLCACAPVLETPPAPPGPGPKERLAAIDAVAGAEDTELDVQPLRDPQVEDLRLPLLVLGRQAPAAVRWTPMTSLRRPTHSTRPC